MLKQKLSMGFIKVLLIQELYSQVKAGVGAQADNETLRQLFIGIAVIIYSNPGECLMMEYELVTRE